jgi:hypothetical protein
MLKAEEGDEQVAANEDALQQLHKEKHECVEKRLAELEFFLFSVQFFEDGTEEKPAKKMRSHDVVELEEQRTAVESLQGPEETSTAHSA